VKVGRYVRVFVTDALAGYVQTSCSAEHGFDLDAVASALGREGVESLYASWHQPLLLHRSQAGRGSRGPATHRRDGNVNLGLMDVCKPRR
jgi:hypothetical protein